LRTNDVQDAVERVSRWVALKGRGGADEDEIRSTLGGGAPETLARSSHTWLIDGSGSAGLGGCHFAEWLGEIILAARAHLVELSLVYESDLAGRLRWDGGGQRRAPETHRQRELSSRRPEGTRHLLEDNERGPPDEHLYKLDRRRAVEAR
jgi:hypothetical protein